MAEWNAQRRTVLAAGLALLLAPQIVACSRKPESKAGRRVLRVGDQRGSTRALLNAAGELASIPYPVEWALFAVGAPLIEAMKAGAVDFGYVGSSTMTFGLAANAPLKAISTWQIEGVGSALLVPPDSSIRTLADLRGKRIAVVRGSPGHLLVAQALRSAGIPIDAVTIVNLAPGDAKAALGAHAVDAWSIWDPYFAIGQQQDHLRPLASSAQFGGEVETGVATLEAIADKRTELLDFIGRVRRGYAWAEANPEKYAEVFAKDTGVPLDIARIVKTRVHITVEPSISDASIARHQRAADIYADIGLIPHHLAIAKVYDRSFMMPG